MAYLTKARGWLDAASESLAAERWDVAAGCAVMAGINACDVVCGFLLGERSGGSDHTEAVGLLATAGNDGRTASRQLAQLFGLRRPRNMTQCRSRQTTRARPSNSLPAS